MQLVDFLGGRGAAIRSTPDEFVRVLTPEVLRSMADKVEADLLLVRGNMDNLQVEARLSSIREYLEIARILELYNAD